MIETANQPSVAPPATANGTAGWDYQQRAGLHDEMLAADRQPRPHWHDFLQALTALGLPELTRRWEEAKLLIHENGVTYNVYGDPRGMDRPWQLDPIPLLISPEEGRVIESGLIQRGRLLEAILADLYGPQHILREGLLPAELVFANPGFLRPCHGYRPVGGHFLHLYAANLGRAPDGRVFVLGDRTQGPSGAGYALENRIVLSRMLPDVFRDCRVQRLALFFRTFRDTLRSIAPHNRDNPRIVLLTPGAFNETYFEHAYLARYLGYTLVEGGDLTMRDNKVYLKVLGGLQQVDVIFRRLDDDFCDPLELRGDSFLGVPGLVQAVRSGQVAVANALGSGLAEMPALLPYLPRLARRLLDEELALPSAATWWCGEPHALDHVLARLAQMVIKPANSSVRLEPVFGDRLSSAELAALAGRIRSRPRDYVGQEQLPLSTAPVLAGDRLQPRQLVLRAYLAASGDTFVLMPGGLTRVTASPDTMVVSMQQGGGSKDTWVLSSGPVSTFSLLRSTTGRVELSRGGGDLPSRVADNLYWLGRYAERGEGLTRLLRGILVRLTERSGLAEAPELPALLRAAAHQGDWFPGMTGRIAEERLTVPEDELRALVFDRARAGSLASVLEALPRVAGMVRDRISNDMWRVISSLAWEEIGVAGPRENGHPEPALPDALDLLDRTVQTLAAFGGLAFESMTRGYGWRFLDMGRRLERSMHLLALLRSSLTTAQSNEGPLLEALLEIADSSMTYRRRYLSSLQTTAVLDLLLADETNPRSLAFQLLALSDDIENLPRETASASRSPEQRIMLSALTALRLAEVEQLSQVDAQGDRPLLEQLLGRLATDLPALSDSVTRSYLSHLQASRHLAGEWVSPEEDARELTAGEL
jgi:uncharacterized circularly permuted ATP-grasp superfamily protein/uncharacterized alpha-E superfamily protein